MTFVTDVADLAVVEAKALELADTCAARLRRLGFVGRTVAVKVRTSDFRTLSRSRTLLAPTDVGREVFLVARTLLAGVDLRGLPVRLVGVRAEGLSRTGDVPHQPTLEEAVAGPGRRAAELAVDEVRARFGTQAIGPGTSRAANIALSGHRSERSTTTFAPVELS